MNDFLDEDMDNFFGSSNSQPQPTPQQQVQQAQTYQPFGQQQSKPVQVNQSIVQQNQNQAISPFSSLNIDLGIPSIVVAETGVTVSRYPIDKVQISSQKPVRFSVLIDKVIVVPYHYIPGAGSVICNNGKCCEYSSKRNIRYVYYVVEYSNTDNKGKIVGGGVELKSLSLPSSHYEQLVQIQNLKGNLSQYDIVVSAKDKGENYMDVTFTEAGPVSWLRSNEAKDYIQEKFSKDGKYILDGIARSVSDEELDRLVQARLESPDVDISKLKQM